MERTSAKKNIGSSATAIGKMGRYPSDIDEEDGN